MTTAPFTRLVFGPRRLVISSGRYKVGLDFKPPPVDVQPILAPSASSSRYLGSKKFSERAYSQPWSFSIIVNGDTDAETHRAQRDLVDFLSLAGTSSRYQLILEYNPNSDIGTEPHWGQYGTHYRYIITHAAPPQLWENYSGGNVRAKAIIGLVTCLIKPFVFGKEQILAQAKGAVLIDNIGKADGQARGVIVAVTTSNIITNPIFGHPTTWNTGWTTGTGSALQNVDPEFIIYGTSSAKLTNSTSFYQSLSVAATPTYLSCLAKLEDGGTITAAKVSLWFNNADVTGSTTVTSLGDGWYRLTYADTPTAGTRQFGVACHAGYTVYVDAFLLSLDREPIPCHGDLPGHSWNSTAHDSTSTRTSGRIRLDNTKGEILLSSTWSMRVVVRANYDSSLYTANPYIFADHNGNIEAYWNQATSKFVLEDGTNTITQSTTTTWSTGDILVFHYVATIGSLKIYLNGSQIATGSTYTPPARPDYLHLGSTQAGANYSNFTFMDVATWTIALSATEVSNDYNNLIKVVEENQALGGVPYFWTQDQDNVVDNCDDSTRDNWAYAASIPGNYPAVTRILGEVSVGWTGFDAWISNFTTGEQIKPGDILYGEFQGTVDANSSGGEYQSQTVSTTAVLWSKTISNFMAPFLLDKEVHLFHRMYDAGSNMTASFRLSIGGVIETDFKSISTTTAFRLFRTSAIAIPGNLILNAPEIGNLYTGAFAIQLKRTTGSAAARVDFTILMPRPIMRLYAGATVGAGSEGFIYASDESRVVSKQNDDTIQGFLLRDGDSIELEPGKINNLVSLIGQNAGTHTITSTLTYERVYITPRWGVV